MSVFLGYPSQKIKETIKKRDGWTKIYYVDGTSTEILIEGELTEESIGEKDNIQKVEIGTAVTSIGEYAFYQCISLTSITIPDSVTSIGKDAFYQCISLTSITIPNSVTSIGEYAFGNCTSLASITIPNSVTSIEICTFYWCSSLTSIIIGNSVTSIKDAVFMGCKNLQQLSCLASTAPITTEPTFGVDSSDYTGRNYYSVGTNTLYVPSNAIGYDASYWADPLQNSTKCGFNISKTL